MGHRPAAHPHPHPVHRPRHARRPRHRMGSRGHVPRRRHPRMPDPAVRPTDARHARHAGHPAQDPTHPTQVRLAQRPAFQGGDAARDHGVAAGVRRQPAWLVHAGAHPGADPVLPLLCAAIAAGHRVRCVRAARRTRPGARGRRRIVVDRRRTPVRIVRHGVGRWLARRHRHGRRDHVPDDVRDAMDPHPPQHAARDDGIAAVPHAADDRVPVPRDLRHLRVHAPVRRAALLDDEQPMEPRADARAVALVPDSRLRRRRAQGGARPCA
ncbi:hypothetical protein BCAL_1017 [Bifidobacterium callitrichos DSM 23973]|uniref:Uncharacterized protein n=1 Tax=Bifidobacterium callitrichos DSM 23973 TaxID=1437609 RepID=A0A086ZXN7_9BIFI|nr:hypothetical protein BCAL_1017 [Bifidobacterium callitrichos DSM 23973]